MLDECFTRFFGHRVEHVFILRVSLRILVGIGRHIDEHAFLVFKDADTVYGKRTDVCACKRLELLRIIIKELVDPDADLGYGNFCRFRLHILGRFFCLFGWLLLFLNGRSIAGAFL